MEGNVLFYIWWLSVNGVQDYLAIDFLFEATGGAGRKRQEQRGKWERRHQVTAWMAISLLMTFAAIRFSIPCMALLHMLCLLVFARGVFGMEWVELAAPAAILFTLATFTEGASAVALAWLSSSVRVGDGGAMLQVLISFLSLLIFFLGLGRVRKRYLDALYGAEASVLYLLLLPSACMTLLIRFCLRLDSPAFEEYLSFVGKSAGMAVALVMAAAFLLFFLILEMLERILAFAEERQETRRRNERLISFQHDIDNHLLVLSGMLQEQRYTEAAGYAGGLCEKTAELPVFPSSGSVGLDILLREKLSEAKKYGIEASCDVRIPKECTLEEMDLCTLFANLLDNAIHGCREYVRLTGEVPDFWIKTSVRGQIFMVESENTAAFSKAMEEGIGLGNVRQIAGRYQGTVEIEAENARFRVCVLLCV